MLQILQWASNDAASRSENADLQGWSQEGGEACGGGGAAQAAAGGAVQGQRIPQPLKLGDGAREGGHLPLCATVELEERQHL